MNRHSGINDNNKKDRTKAIAAIPMVGAIVTAALLLSGLSLIGSYPQPVMAQQNMTGGDAGIAAGNVTNATTAGNATNMTTTGTEGGEEGEGDGGILEDIFGGGGG